MVKKASHPYRPGFLIRSSEHIFRSEKNGSLASWLAPVKDVPSSFHIETDMIPPSAILLPLGHPPFLSSFFRDVTDEIYLDEAKNELWYRFDLVPELEGPPGLAHGGFSAAILDEAMGAVVWLQGIKAVAGKLQFRYRKPVPLNRTLYVRSGIIRRSGSRARARAELFLDEHSLLVSAEGLYISSSHWQQDNTTRDWLILLQLHEKLAEGKSATQALRDIQSRDF